MAEPASPYTEIDDVIHFWVKATGSTLFREWDGRPWRSFHLPGDAPYACFQVSISPPRADRLTVLAAVIDTNDDSEAELEQCWEGPVADLHTMLAAAVAAVKKWKARPGRRAGGQR